MLKATGIILRVLAVLLLLGFVAGGVFVGKFASWFRSGSATSFNDILTQPVNWMAAGAVWLIGLCVSVATYGQGLILAAFARRDKEQ